ncbi:hypothetical protein GCM10020369_17870 [Cryptosporangium minutisporangium]|uniref:TIR domain-containing protein n=2 Tax=Cryptosporangium minutisporangium TaxID=113569 RepID=A0ABP6STN2_9ACTN
MAARLLDSRLTGVFGRESVFLDSESLPAGEDFRPFLNRRLQTCDVLLVVIGPHWLTLHAPDGQRLVDRPDDFVSMEIAVALQRPIKVIPILLDGAPDLGAASLPAEISDLAHRQRKYLRERTYESDLDDIVRVLRGILGEEPDVEARSGRGDARATNSHNQVSGNHNSFGDVTVKADRSAVAHGRGSNATYNEHRKNRTDRR